MEQFGGVIIALLLTACLLEGVTVPRGEESEPKVINGEWLWGYADVLVPKNMSENLVSSTPEPDNEFEECKPYNPPIPDFKTPGRRISEAKCDEYIWNIKLNQERSNRSGLCSMKKRLKENGGIIYHGIIGTVGGGRDTYLGEFPHMGAIGWPGTSTKWVFKCCGSLISSKFVLTAAHCSRASSADTSLADPVPKLVRLGHKNINLNENTKTINIYDVNISRIVLNPNCTPPTKYNDIALIELQHEVGFNQFVQPSCLWGQRDISKLGSIATLTGWGVLHQDSTKISEELQAAVIDILDDKVCNRLLESSCNRNWCGVQEHQICAGKLAGGVDACQGDSGGPLQVGIELDFVTPYRIYNVIGVTSFGVGCAQPNLPGIYTRVSSFIDWIEEIVWPCK